MQKVVLSVCIPVYNCRAHIVRAVDSVLGQTFTDYEFIIIDNCSDDGTYELLAAYSDHRIKLLRNDTNIGACGNWNRALREAAGRYIKILCADDILYPTCLEKQLAVLEAADRSVAMVSCSRDIIDESGRKVVVRQYPGRGGRIDGQRVIRKAIRRGTNVIGEVSAVMFRRDITDELGGFECRLPYVIDLDFWFRILCRGDLFVIRETLCAYRISRGSWSLAIADSQRSDFSALIEKVSLEYQVPVSSIDSLLGHVMARVNACLRKVFYQVFL